MEKNTVTTIARYTTGAALGLGALAWTYPVWRRPDVQALAVTGAEGALIIGLTAGSVLTVGYVWHRLETWARARPPALTAAQLPAVFANDVDAVALAHEELRHDDAPDFSDGWKHSITKFALLGNLEGFGWRAMCKFVGRADWRQMLDLLTGAEVLTKPRGNQAQTWAGPWSYTKFRVAVKHDRLRLPFPTATPPPVVTW